MESRYLKIGKFVAAFGLKGELILKHSLGKKTALKGLQAIFIEDRKESFLPWFISSVKIKTADENYLKLESIESREGATKLVQKEVWITEADFNKFSAKSSPINLLGFTVIDQGTPLGEILELIEQPHQMLCRIEIKSKEVLIPLNESTLKKVDKKNRQVVVSLPDGLLEVYL